MVIRLDAKNISSRTSNQPRKENKKKSSQCKNGKSFFIRAYRIGEWDSSGGASVTRDRASGAEDRGDGTPR